MVTVEYTEYRGRSEITVLVPLSDLGLTPRTAQFRMQAVMCAKPSPEIDKVILPLIGGTVSYHDSSRFCVVSVKGD